MSNTPFRELDINLFKPQITRFAMNVALRHHRTDEIIGWRLIEAESGAELAEKYLALSSHHKKNNK